MKFTELHENKFKLTFGTIKSLIIKVDQKKIYEYLITGSSFKKYFHIFTLNNLSKHLFLLFYKSVVFKNIMEKDEIKIIHKYFENLFDDYNIISLTVKPSWEKSCLYLIVNDLDNYFFVKIIKIDTPLIEELNKEIEMFKKLESNNSINFPKLVGTFKSKNFTLLITNYQNGRYKKLSDQNFTDLDNIFKNMMEQSYIKEGKFFSHCDLAPWNYKFYNDRCVIIDWGSVAYKEKNYDKYYYHLINLKISKRQLKQLPKINQYLYTELKIDLLKRLQGDAKLLSKVLARIEYLI